MCTTNVLRFLMLFLYCSVTISFAYNETTVNEMAAKMNMSNQTLLAFFNNLNNANLSSYYNSTELDSRFNDYNYTFQSINGSINLALGKLLSSLLDSYVNASIANASRTISPIISILRDDMNTRFDAFRNSTVRNYQLERNITELNASLANYAYSVGTSVRYDLNTKTDGNFLILLILIFMVPTGIYLATTRIYSLRMKILGSAEDVRRYAIEDLNLNPLTKEEIYQRKKLKLKIIKLKCRPYIMKALLNRVDTNDINEEDDIDDWLQILTKEEEIKNEENDKHTVKQAGKRKRE